MSNRRVIIPLLILLFTQACSSGPARSTDGGSSTTQDGQPPAVDAYFMPAGGSVAEKARALAMHLRGDAHFMVGMGNDLGGDRPGAYTLGVDLDVHYVYLVGYSDQNGWAVWNPDGQYATYAAEGARDTGGVTPMFTYYQLALDYEQMRDALRDAGRMQVYLGDVRLLMMRLGEFGMPAIIHWEPDFFAYLQQRMSEMGTSPAEYSAQIRQVPECMSLPETAASLLPCIIAMRNALAPQVRMGAHASQWAAWYDVTSPDADIEGSGRGAAAFLTQMGANQLDFIVVETLDRDAGFWETNGGGAECSVSMGARGPVYWDESNASLPNFAQHFRWVGALTTALGIPAIWWQMPFGVPSEACGGSDQHWRDNRVRYFFSHVDQAIAAGGAGMLFGAGAGGQTYITTDDGQFQRAAQGYFASPVALP